MRLNENFIYHISNGETVIVPTGSAEFSGVVRGNKTLGAILDLLHTDTTEEEIIAKLMQRYDVPEDIVSKDVKKALSELQKIGALDI